MAVIASGEIDLKLSAKSQAGLENTLAKVSNKAGTSSGKEFSNAFLSKTKGLTGGIEKSLGSISTGTLVAGVGAAAGAIAAFAFESIKHFEDTAQEVRAFQRVTGQTAEDASHLVGAFHDMGISSGEASKSMGLLARNVANGGKSLTDLGVSIAHTKDGGVDLNGTFLNVADSVAAAGTSTERVNIAMKAFGRSGRDLLPILQLGREGIIKLTEETNLSFNQKQLDSAEAYRRSLVNLDEAVGKVENTIGGALVPTLTKTVNGLAFLVTKADSGAKSIGGLGNVIGFVSNVAAPGLASAIGFVGSFGDKASSAGLSTTQLASASATLGVSIDALAGKTQDEVLALGEEKKALDSVYAATLAGFDANFALQDSYNTLQDATDKVNEARKAQTDGSVEAGAATEALQRALLAEAEASLRTADAAGKVAEQEALASGARDATIPKIDAQIAALEREKHQVAGENVPAIQAMIDKLTSIRSEYHTTIGVDTAGATQKILGLGDLIANVLRTANTPKPVALTGTAAFNKILGANGKPNDAISVFPPGLSLFNNQTGKDETVVNADLVRPSGPTYITVNEVAQDPEATAHAVAARLGAASQR